MASLLQVPNEMLLHAISYLSQPEDLFSLACTCQRLQALTKPVLSGMLTVTKYEDPEEIRNSLRSVLRCPGLRFYFKTVTIDCPNKSEMIEESNPEAERDVEIFRHALERSGLNEGNTLDARTLILTLGKNEHNASAYNDNDSLADVLIALFLSLLPNLESLSIVGMADGDKYLSRAVQTITSPDPGRPALEREAFRQLRHVTRHHWDTEDGFAPSEITQYFRLPSIEEIFTFSMDGASDRDIGDPNNLEPGTSSVTKFDFTHSCMDDTTLAKILRAPRALESFYYDYGDGSTVGISSFIPGEIVKALHQQKHSLEYLGLDVTRTDLESEKEDFRERLPNNEYLATIGSLHAFERLVNVSVNIILLLGESPEEASLRLMDIFPPTLEYFESDDFRTFSSNASKDAIIEQFLEVLEQKDERFPNLRTIKLLQFLDKASRTLEQQNLVKVGKSVKVVVK